MKHLPLIIGALVALSLPALAEEPQTCFNSRYDYRANAAGYHDVIAENTIGVHRARVRLTTSCIDLHNADYVTLSTRFSCLSKGDRVVATTLGMPRQSCVVTNIVPEPVPPPAPGN